LGIDKFAYCKGKKDYAVVVVDLDRAVVYDVLENRDKEALIAYFKANGAAFCADITLFSCDMWRLVLS
jgi:transposase